MKFSKDNRFAFFERSLNGKSWTEILNLTKIVSVQEYRICRQVYSNDPGKRNGYKVYVEGGSNEGFWINDLEFNTLLKAGIFGEIEE